MALWEETAQTIALKIHSRKISVENLYLLQPQNSNNMHYTYFNSCAVT